MADKSHTALDLLPTAKDLLKRGMWPQAEVLYRHIIARDPEQAEAFNDLGIVCACLGHLSEAEGYARTAIALEATSPIFHVNLAKHLFGMNQADEAEAAVYAALALDCRHAAAIEALDLMQEQRRQAIEKLAEQELAAKAEAEKAAREQVVDVPVEPEPEKADLALEAPANCEPSQEPAENSVGLDEAKESVETPVEPEPIEEVSAAQISSEPAAAARKAVAAPYRGRLRTSDDETQAAASQPKVRAEVLSPSPEQQLSAAYKSFAERDYDAVIHKLRVLEADHPGHPLAALWTALCHFRLDDLKRARGWADRALKIAPKDHAAYLASGLISQAELDFETAEDLLRRGMELAPKNADFYSALAFQKLLTGDWPEGWRLFDKVNQALTKARLGTGAEPWKGERLTEENLHIWAMEGVGDFLMMARLLPELEARADNLVIECDERLVPLLRRSMDTGEIIALRKQEDSNPLPALGNMQASDRAVIRHLAPDLCPTQLETGLLKPDDAKVYALRKSYEERFPGQLLVGLSWYTTSPAQGRARSVLPEMLEPLLAQSHCQFVDVQYRDPAQSMHDYALPAGQVFCNPKVDARDDLDGLAAQMAALDLVITVDNSTAQLAGALGIPGWVLLHQLPDWRWGMRGDASAWYPSLRLFRQSEQGDWSSVIAQISEKLSSGAAAGDLRRSA